ncbi:hypothetical protein AH156_19885 [Salmonella enterica subsp. enterica serovar Enteritidis]|nr:hypothetical protein [Salmonella enterica subsp. enterica serovar Enteritidis]
MARTTQTANRVNAHFVDFRDKGYRDLRLDHGADGRVVLVGRKYATDKTFTEHTKVIYTPRNGYSKTSTKNYMRIAGEFQYFARANPGVCSVQQGEFIESQQVVGVIVMIGMVIFTIIWLATGHH